MAAVVSFRSITTPRYLTGLIAAVAVGAALMAALHANSIGMSGQDFSFESQALSGRRGLRAYFSGQDIALGVIAVPLLTVISFVLAAVAGHPVDGFLGLSVALAAIGAGLAVSNVFTVALPYPVEKRARQPGAQARRRLHGSAPRWAPSAAWLAPGYLWSRSCSPSCSPTPIRP